MTVGSVATIVGGLAVAAAPFAALFGNGDQANAYLAGGGIAAGLGIALIVTGTVMLATGSPSKVLVFPSTTPPVAASPLRRASEVALPRVTEVPLVTLRF